MRGGRPVQTCDTLISHFKNSIRLPSDDGRKLSNWNYSPKMSAGACSRDIYRRLSLDGTEDELNSEGLCMSNTAIDQFLGCSSFAVVGASEDRSKYGNKVLRCYLQNDRRVFPINPRSETVEGLDCYRDLASIPERVEAVSVITPPAISEGVIQQAAELGIKHIWLQPGAENPRCIELGEEFDLNLIAGGPCLLVALGYREN